MMPPRVFQTLLAVCCVLTIRFVSAGIANAADGQAPRALLVGVGVQDITPAPGYPLSGYYHERGAEGTLDPLHAKALYFRQGDVQAALVACDVIGIRRQLATEIRRGVTAQTGIPGEHLIVTGTHTHTGPDYGSFLDKYLQTQQSGQPSDEERVRYIGRLIDKAVKAVVDAKSTAKPAQVQAGSAQVPGVAFNRRFHMKDGSVRFNPGVGNADIVRPAGPTDPQAGAILFHRAGDREPFVGLINFAMHLDTVGGTNYSADYPHFLEQGLRKRLGSDFVSVFGTGTCGDVNHINVGGESLPRGPLGITRMAGERLAEAIAVARSQFPAAAPTLTVRRAVVEAPLQTCTDEDLAWAREIVAQDRAGKPLPFLEEVKAYKLLRLDSLRREHGDKLPLEVHVLRFGSQAALVTFPGELFVELGLAVKKASPAPTTLVVELANTVDTIYIPTRKAYEEGSYEVTNSMLQPGSGELLVDAAIRLLRE